MKIAFDLDDTLADFVSAFFLYHNDVYKTNFVRNDLKEYELTSLKGGPKDLAETIARITDFYKTKSFEEILPIPYAKEAIDSLAKNHELIVITSRHLDVEHKTKQWVEKNFPGKFKDIFLTDYFSTNGKPKKRKSEVCREYHVDCLVDDHVLFIEDCIQEGINTIIVDSPWNQQEKISNPNILRVSNLRQVEGLLPLIKRTK